jgi:quercetin dioxygenase-like cupin family protein
MLRHLAARRIRWLCPALLLFVLPLAAQSPPQTPAAVPVSKEPHHHLVLENSYVRAYYVDVAPHESTLRHRHDLPYFAVLLSGGGPAAAQSGGSQPQQSFQAPRAIFSPGGISHAVSNPGDTPFRNVTIELLHPQGAVRNRCEQIVRGQPLEQCDSPASVAAHSPLHYAVFETSEILVEYWHIPANVTTRPWDDRLDALLVDLEGASVTAAGGIDSSNAAPGGVLWLSAGSKPVFKTPPDHGGYFLAITFKDSASPSK